MDGCAQNELREPLIEVSIDETQSSNHPVNLSGNDPSEFIRLIAKTHSKTRKSFTHEWLYLVAIPWMFICLVVTRLLQFIKQGDTYDKVTRFKHFLYLWLTLYNFFVLILCLIFLCMDILVPYCNCKIPLVTTIYITTLVSINCGIALLCGRTLPRFQLERNTSGIEVPEAASELIQCLLSWLVLSDAVKHKLLGLQTKSWIEIAILGVAGIDVIYLVTHMFIWSLPNILFLELNPAAPCVMYYAKGLKASFNYLFNSLLMLLAWVFYFRSHLESTVIFTKISIVELGNATCITFFICSFLWLLKNWFLLSWEVKAVYNRFNTRIVKVAAQLYFLGILGRHTYDIFKLRYWRHVQVDDLTNAIVRGSTMFDELIANVNFRSGLETLAGRSSPVLEILTSVEHRYAREYDDADERVGDVSKEGYMIYLSTQKREAVKDQLLIDEDTTPNLDDVQQVSQYFLAALPKLCKDTYTADILSTFTTSDSSDGIMETLKKYVNGTSSLNGEAQQHLTEGTIEEEIAKDDWHYFHKLLNTGDSSQDISFAQLQTWMERAHTSCLSLARLLDSAKETSGCLNNIISGLIMLGCFIMWLLLSGLATPQVFVVIASPFLAATFVFGDTCKIVFQGIIFLYVVHPFSVGDLCILDGQMMVVKSFDIWKTIFTKVDNLAVSGEEVIYPNDQLAIKNITNYKAEFDWRDCVQFNIPSSFDSIKINELKTSIDSSLATGAEEFIPNSYNMEMLSMDSDTTIAIYVEYKNHNVQDWTYAERLQRKKQLQWDFHLHIHKLVKEFIQANTPTQTAG